MFLHFLSQIFFAAFIELEFESYTEINYIQACFYGIFTFRLLLRTLFFMHILILLTFNLSFGRRYFMVTVAEDLWFVYANDKILEPTYSHSPTTLS